MPSLHFRAGQRCEQNILRRYPAWRQANLTDAERAAFETWIASNRTHLAALRAQIVTGKTPDIDRGWPDPAGPDWQVPGAPKAVPAPSVDETLLETLEVAKESVDKATVIRKPFEVGGVSYNFKIGFLQAEQKGDETLKQTDTRLYELYERLELMRPVGITDEEDARRRELFGNFYTYRGPA